MIQIKNINFKYAGQKDHVFNDFSLSLEQNRIYGLLGKNGTGKSTLLYLISGLLRPKCGSIQTLGFESSLRRAEMLQEIFIVPEEFDLPAMSLDAYVRLYEPFYPKFNREVLNNCLRDFELPLMLKLNELSMGQKKKVYMSFALAAGTRLLLMDEPTNGLDIPSKSQFRRVVAQNMTDDRTLIISTHQVHDVEALLDHILIISQSNILMNESVADICNKYVFEYRQPGEMDDDVLYAEPSLQGNAVIARRTEGSAETQLNLELLFTYITKENKLGRAEG
ncbi:MAG: ABC transporter ATP-binding protein [Prevotella sp.]|nr:ABC transporter ATP-binding protein [Prevotella sp.]